MDRLQDSLCIKRNANQNKIVLAFFVRWPKPGSLEPHDGEAEELVLTSDASQLQRSCWPTGSPSLGAAHSPSSAANDISIRLFSVAWVSQQNPLRKCPAADLLYSKLAQPRNATPCRWHPQGLLSSDKGSACNEKAGRTTVCNGFLCLCLLVIQCLPVSPNYKIKLNY